MVCRTGRIFAMSPRAALATLGIQNTSDVTQAVVKKAYVAQTLRCHPDLNPEDPNATEKFRSVSEALRVALKFLDSRREGMRHEKQGRTGAPPSVDGNDNIMEVLREAIVAHSRYREMTRCVTFVDGKRDGFPESHVDPFVNNSLEHVSSICRSEAMAMQRVLRFCKELPEVLCGRSCALFEVVAFFNSRYVEATSQCVLRFSKNLPIIVSRVVKNRKKHVRYSYGKAVSGFGTGSRPQQQRIEDMSMKPLVLLGALIFDQGYGFGRGASDSHNSAHVGPKDDLRGDTRSTCGATRKEELDICDELKCIIRPSDSIGDITENIGRWEAASFNRLQLELAIADVTSLISGIVGLSDHPLTAMNHLHLPKSTSEKVSLTVQKLACGLCYHCEDRGHEMDNSFLEEEAKTISEKIYRCRHLARAVAHYISGNIILIWDEQSSLVESPTEVVADEVEITSGAGTGSVDGKKDYFVVRHMNCCDAEVVQFSVSVRLTKDLSAFVDYLIAAMTRVSEDAETSVSVLPEVLELRQRVVSEEFIPVVGSGVETSGDAGDNAKSSATAGGQPDDGGPMVSSDPGRKNMANAGIPIQPMDAEECCDREYRYRGPIRCFPRIFSMNTDVELVFWKNVWKHRSFLAKCAPTMNPVNIYYNCMPYVPHRHLLHHDLHRDGNDLLAGWVGEADQGTDNAVITRRELQDDSLFLEWLEDVVEQCSLNKECLRIVRESGMEYVSRDPLLPLQHYLSFLKVFSAASAVRRTLEGVPGAVSGETPSGSGSLFIVVGTECDVRDGGRLLVPWWMDPTALLALLQGDNGPQACRLDGVIPALPLVV